jgi:hypothetical protein
LSQGFESEPERDPALPESLFRKYWRAGLNVREDLLAGILKQLTELDELSLHPLP